MVPLVSRSLPRPVRRNGTPWRTTKRRSSPSCKKKTRSATRRKWRTITPPARRREEGERRRIRIFLKEQCKLLVFVAICLLFQSAYTVIHPRSAFMYFSMEKRPKLREENANATVGDLAKMLGAAWRIMTDEQKAPYEEMTRKDRERYEEEMQNLRAGKKATPKAKVGSQFPPYDPLLLLPSCILFSGSLPTSLYTAAYFSMLYQFCFWHVCFECFIKFPSPVSLSCHRRGWYMRRKRMMTKRRRRKKRTTVAQTRLCLTPRM